MSDTKNMEKFWHESQWLSKLLGTGRRRYLLGGLMSIIYMSLFASISMLFEMPKIIINLVVAIALVGLLLSSIISLRLRYWRDVVLWQTIILTTIIVEFFAAGFVLILKRGDNLALFLVSSGILSSIFLAFRSSQRHVKQFELARRKGILRSYLDEENWVYDDDPAKASGLWLAIWKANNETKAKNSLKWLRRLEKLHYLIPGIAISFRRAFGHEDTVIGILFITLGLVSVNILSSSFLSCLKIREWEKERGKPILLRFVWEKEQRQRR